MISVRRSYMYLVSAISLDAITFAFITMLQDLLPLGPRAPVTTIALEIAVIVIGLPFFLVHWLWAQRLASRDQDERGSFIRPLYLYAMLSTFLGAFIANAFDLVAALLQLILRIQPPSPFIGAAVPTSLESLVKAAVAMIVLLALWFYHVLIVRSDAQAVPEADLSGAVRRLYILGFSAVGLTMFAIGTSQLLRWILYQVGGGIVFGAAEQAGLVNELARLGIGIPLWLVFWAWAQRLFNEPNEAERESGLRKLYLYLVVFVAVLGAVSGATIILAGLLRQLLGLTPNGDIRDPLAVVIALVAVWAYHDYVLRRDVSLAAEGPRQAGIRRLYLYLVAGIGLGAFLIGLAGDVSVLIRALGGDFFGSGLKEPLAWFTAALVAGLPVWLLPWRRAQIAAVMPDAGGAGERRSVVRKIYLYFYLFVASMTVLGSAIYIVFRLLSLVLGERGGGNLISDLGQPIAYSLIAIGVWLYHGVVLRGDGRLAQREKAERLSQFRVAVVDAEQGQWGRAVLEELRRELPGLTLVPIGLTLAAREAMGVGANESPLASQLGETKLIVGPWTMASAGGANGAVTPEIAGLIRTSAARKLLVPTSGDGWEWIGADWSNAKALVEQTVRAVKQVVEGEEPKSGRGLHPAVIIVLALIGLCVALQLAQVLFSFFMRGF